MKRSFRVSQRFIDKLLEIQNQSKADGIPKTQEQLLDEMMDVYLLYLNNETNLLITEEMEKSVLNLCNLYLTKQAQAQNSLLEHLDKRIDDIIKRL